MTALRVPVEIAARDRRCWRVCEAIDMGTLRFARELPFERGTAVRVALTLPGGAALGAGGELTTPREVRFAPDAEARAAIAHYLEEAAT